MGAFNGTVGPEIDAFRKLLILWLCWAILLPWIALWGFPPNVIDEETFDKPFDCKNKTEKWYNNPLGTFLQTNEDFIILLYFA